MADRHQTLYYEQVEVSKTLTAVLPLRLIVVQPGQLEHLLNQASLVLDLSRTLHHLACLSQERRRSFSV